MKGWNMRPRNKRPGGLRRALFAALVLQEFVVLSPGLVAQPMPEASQSDSVPTTHGLRKDMLFADVTVQLLDGRRLTGYFCDFHNDTLTMIGGGGKRQISMHSVAELRIKKQANAVPAGVYGMVLGGYLINWLLYRDESGSGFMTSDFTENAYAPLLVALLVGGTCYMVAAAVLPDDRPFYFSGDSDFVAQEKQRFKELVLDGKPSSARPTRFHVLMTGGTVGFPKPSLGTSWFSYPSLDRTFYRVVRRVQIAYSLFPWLQVGGAVIWFDEPAMNTYSNTQYMSDANGYSYSDTSFSRTFKGTAYVACGAVAPLQSLLPEEIRWQLGGGIGVGRIDYRATFSTFHDSYSSTGETQFSQVATEATVGRTRLAATLFTQIDLFLYRELSIGLAIDYTFMPGTRIPALPEGGMKSHIAGNTCVGVGIGLHF
jgi:hypothetical protein